MKDHSKKTSRRSFGKQLTGAIAALPIASLGMKAIANEEDTQRRKTATPICARTHDTPPPTEIIDGSCKAESGTKLDQTHDSAKNRWYYDKTSYPDVVHIKVLHGSGDMIYRNLDAKNTVKEIRISLTSTAGDLVIAGNVIDSAGRPVFRINSDKKLNYLDETKGKRHHKYEHPGAGRDFRVESIDVVGTAGNTLFSVKPPLGSTDPEEYRVMIWHEAD